ncbi:MAG: DEAD/DEAH box helicase family protein, partial [Oscillospiraceae bacterium]|nr:DEAD/DEAH box helicase family protein [Oscillospiraceae bacterium]
MIAKIAVEGLIYSIDKPYSYAVPPATVLRPGQRVSVPFGRGNRVSEGMVLSVEEGEREGLKQILAVLDPEPVMTEGQLRLAAFVRERSFCTFYDAIHAMLPGGLWIENREIWKLEDLPADWEDRLSGDPVAVGVVRLLQSCGGTLSLEALFRQTGERKHTREAVEALRARRWLSVQTENRRKQSDKTERMVRCAASGDVVAEFLRKKRRSAPMQAAVMDLLATVDTVSWKELRYFTGASLQTLHALERSGMVEVYAEEVLRSPAIVPTDRDVSFPLNPDQSAVFEGLRRQMRSPVPGAALLQGVTGSGKTAVYIHLIRDCLANGKSAMLLVPEIALTPQLLSLFAACFGKQIAVMHSALPVGERFDAYKRVARGEARVVVGTRSAVFAPLQ